MWTQTIVFFEKGGFYYIQGTYIKVIYVEYIPSFCIT
jgi:hypothetical protein